MNTEIICVIDESGSMGPLTKATLLGFNSFLAEQRRAPGNARLSLVLFSTIPTVRLSGAPLHSVRDLSREDYRPDGGTALHDALVGTVRREGLRIAQQRWADQVIVVVITDGEENSSRAYSLKDVRRVTEHSVRYGWQWVYLAANVDAFSTGAAMGIPAQYTQSYAATEAGVGATYSAMSATLRSLRTEGVVK